MIHGNTRNLKFRLQERVKGKISAHIEADILIVSITLNQYSTFQYTIEDMANQMCMGLTSEMAAQLICKKYERFILNKYFRKKKFKKHLHFFSSLC